MHADLHGASGIKKNYTIVTRT